MNRKTSRDFLNNNNKKKVLGLKNRGIALFKKKNERAEIAIVLLAILNHDIH